jgi:hypothetical protein
MKVSTKDVDLMFLDIDKEKLRRYTLNLAKQYKIKIDIWQFPFIFSTTLSEDSSSEIYSTKYKHFDIRVLNSIDIAVSKLARFNEADREDIDTIIKKGTNPSKIIDRFNIILNNNGFGNKEDALRNFEIFKQLQK